MSNSQTLSDSPCCSLGKIFSLNCPCKKHISGAGIPLIPVAKIIEKNITWHISCYFLMFGGIFSIKAIGEEDICLHVTLPVAAFLEMLTKSVTKRTTTATRPRCVQRGMGQTTPFSGRVSRNAAEDDPRPNTLQLTHRGVH